jgi:hypothetical protein
MVAKVEYRWIDPPKEEEPDAGLSPNEAGKIAIIQGIMF